MQSTRQAFPRRICAYYLNRQVLLNKLGVVGHFPVTFNLVMGWRVNVSISCQGIREHFLNS